MNEAQSWEKKIRHDYNGIVSDEQIEATVEYWRSLIAQVETTARQEGISLQAQLCKEQKEIVRKEALEEAAKIAEDYADLKKGHGIEAFDTSEAIAQRIRTSLTE